MNCRGMRLPLSDSQARRVTTEVQLPLIAYLGDTRGIPLDVHPLLKQCQVADL